MCLIISHGAEALSWQQFASVWELNPHGYGAVKTDGTVFRTLDRVKAWIWYRENSADVAVSHWRFATHGDVNSANIHPFVAKHRLVFHNGILQGYGKGGVSDSADFVARHVHGDLLMACRKARTTAFAVFDRRILHTELIGDDWHTVGEYGEFSNRYAYDANEFADHQVCDICGAYDEGLPVCETCYFDRKDEE